MADEATTLIQEQEKDEATGKFVYNYQPRDSEGQFIGKPYRFLYTDHQDLVRQLTEAKEHGDRFIYEVKTGKRQIKGEQAAPVATYEPAPESADEAEKKRREETRKSIEQEFGAPVETVRRDIKEAREIREFVIANTWAMNNPDYYACQENAKAIDKYMKANKLAMTPSNLDLAFEELKDSLKQPPQEQAAPADSTQQQVEPTKEQPKPRSTGIVPGQFQGTRPGIQPERKPLTMERFRQIDRMSRDQFNSLKRSNPKEYWAFVEMKSPKAQPQQ